MRANDPELAAKLREVLPAHVMREVDAPPNLSLCVGDDEGAIREFHRLYRGHRAAVRTRSKGRLLRATLAHLDAFAGEPEGTVRFDGSVLVRDGAAAVVGPEHQLDAVERRLEQFGYRVADVPGVPLDPDALEVTLWTPRLEVDSAALAAIGRELPSVEPEIALGPARLPVRRVVIGGNDDEAGSGAQTLVALAHLVAPSDGVGQDELALARRLLAHVEVRPCPGDEGALLASLRDELRS